MYQVIQFNGELAQNIGLNESMVLSKIQYWLQHSKHIINGKAWIYNTYEQWQKQFPFWSIRTVRRVINNLEKKGILLSGNFNKFRANHTKWYTINDVCLVPIKPVPKAAPKAEPKPVPKAAPKAEPKAEPTPTPPVEKSWPEGVDKLATSSHITTTEIKPIYNSPAAQDNTPVDNSETEKPEVPFQEIISYLNSKTGKNFAADTKKTRIFLKLLWLKGFRLKNILAVIDKKVAQWQDTKFAMYLRPKTLFRLENFESYANETMVTEAEKPKPYCEKCGGTGYIAQVSVIDGEEYVTRYTCDCYEHRNIN